MRSDYTAELVIFDCDGVLVDSEAIAARVAAEVMAQVGFSVTGEQMMSQYAGLSAAAVTQALEQAHNRKAPLNINDLRRQKIMDAFLSELRPIPGIADVLKQLTLAKCVASSSHPERIALSLRVTGLGGFFGADVFSSAMVARGKPAPDLFLYAASQMRATPDRCVVVEDSTAGVQGARAAGMRVLGFCGGSHCKPGHAERLLAAGAHQVLHRMTTLPSVLSPSHE